MRTHNLIEGKKGMVSRDMIALLLPLAASQTKVHNWICEAASGRRRGITSTDRYHHDDESCRCHHPADEVRLAPMSVKTRPPPRGHLLGSLPRHVLPAKL